MALEELLRNMEKKKQKQKQKTNKTPKNKKHQGKKEAVLPIMPDAHCTEQAREPKFTKYKRNLLMA